MTYSYTRLTTFEDCPLKYKFQYRERRPATLGDTIEAVMGRRVHETLEKLYRDLQMTRLPSLDALTEYYRCNWEKHWDDSIRVIRKEFTPDDYRRKGLKCVEEYYRRYHPFDQGRTIGIEKGVKVDLGNGRVLRGIIDRLDRREKGVYEIHDYKTSGRLPGQETVDRDRQLALYQMGVESMWEGVGEVVLVWHYLVFDSELRSRRSPLELKELTKEVNALIDAVEAAEKFEAKPGVLCDWCEFRNLCPEWKHQYLLEELSPPAFQAEDGVRLVDRYAGILREEDRLRQEKEELKQAVSDYCASFGYEVVFGTENKLRVRRLKSLRFPPAGQARREELEELLRRAGKWNEFAALNVRKLEAALQKGDLPEKLAAELIPFSKEEAGVRLTLSRLKPEER